MLTEGILVSSLPVVLQPQGTNGLNLGTEGPGTIVITYRRTLDGFVNLLIETRSMIKMRRTY